MTRHKTRTRTKPPGRTKKTTGSGATPGGDVSPVRSAEWPEVLTLAEAAAYLRVPEPEVVRMVGPRGLPGRLLGTEWRFSKTALDQWLRTPPAPSTRESLLALTGVWKDDPDVEEMLQEIHRRRGRPMTEDAP
jgi:excisionase family DNA binding protein